MNSDAHKRFNYCKVKGRIRSEAWIGISWNVDLTFEKAFSGGDGLSE